MRPQNIVDLISVGLTNPGYVDTNINPFYFSIFNSETIINREWIIAEINNEIIGYVSYNTFGDDIKLRVICVASHYKNKNIATQMLNMLFSFKKPIKVGYYEPDGEYWIRPKIDQHNHLLDNGIVVML
jgi:hypothetical protein